MNDNMRDELSRSLHQQADGIHGAPISFEDVRGTAGRIRSRRRAVVAGAVLAVGAAIAVPTAVMSGLGDDRGSNTPVVTDPTPTVDVAEGLDLRGLQQGDAPGIAWLEGRTLHRADGSEATLPKAYTRIVAWDDHWVAIGDQDRVDLVADDGLYVVDSWQAFENADLVTNAEGTNVAWMGADGNARVLTEGVIVPRQMGPFDFGTRLVAITGDCATDAETTVGGGCRLWANFEDAGDSVFLSMDNHTLTAEPASETLIVGQDVVAVEGGVLRLGLTEITDDGNCSALTGPQADSPTWTTCEHQPLRFSPDGGHVVARGPQDDGIGDSEVTILDVTNGDVVVSLDNRESQSFVNRAVWEDDEHVLATVFQAGEWAMVRIGLDGSMEYAVAPRAGEDMETPYFLATQP